MSAARGDLKPCTRTPCPGTMQFGREPLAKGSALRGAEGGRGWICSEKTEHFQRESERAPSELAANRSAHASWDDEGGAASNAER